MSVSKPEKEGGEVDVQNKGRGGAVTGKEREWVWEMRLLLTIKTKWPVSAESFSLNSRER